MFLAPNGFAVDVSEHEASLRSKEVCVCVDDLVRYTNVAEVLGVFVHPQGDDVELIDAEGDMPGKPKGRRFGHAVACRRQAKHAQAFVYVDTRPGGERRLCAAMSFFDTSWSTTMSGARASTRWLLPWMPLNSSK